MINYKNIFLFALIFISQLAVGQNIVKNLDIPSLQNASIGFLALTISGDTIASSNPTLNLVPASNLKLITTGAAIHSLGGDYRFETKIGYSGKISNGILEGDIYIIGGGDPTLAAKDSSALDIERIFSEWTRIIKTAGINKINGYIVGDDRLFEENMAEEDSWSYSDLGVYYGAGARALNFYENVQDFSVKPAKNKYERPIIRPTYPVCPWMKYTYKTQSGKPKSGNSLYYYTTDLAPVGEVRGSFAIDRNAKTEHFSNKFPAYTCAEYFKNHLNEEGITVSMGCADMSNAFSLPASRLIEQDSVKIIGSTFSPELKDIIYECNHESNNFYAEAIMKTLGREYCERACYDSAYVAINGIIRELLPDYKKGMKISDGSGLSRENLITSEFMCNFLKRMLDSPNFSDYIESIPSPSDEGTLKYLMPKSSEQVRSRIKMKSGSLSGVRCFSGYIIPKEEQNLGNTIVFSLLINNFNSKTYILQPSIDQLLDDLVNYYD